MGTSSLPSPVDYPALRINGVDYQFRYTKSSQFSLDRWEFQWRGGKIIPAMAWAAAMLGTVDSRGDFHSCGFVSPTQFTDMLSADDDEALIYQKVTEALKKAAPKATVTLNPTPATDSSAGSATES